MIKSTYLSAVVFMLWSPLGISGTIIKIQNNNELTTVLTDGQRAKMTMAGDEYVIVDYKSQQMNVVNPQKQEVMVMDTSVMPKTGNAPTVHTELKQKGAGSNVAGYGTQKFEYYANGKLCGVVYGSKKAYQVKGIKELFNAMKAMVERQQAVLGGFAGMMDACTLADMKMSDHVSSVGVPMRTEKKGRIEMEIRSIQLDANVPAATFSIPASYRKVSMQDQMNAMDEGAKNIRKQVQQHQPQMQQMMQQMQQSGQLTPEMMEQMRRAQEMMQQYQQQ